MESNRETKILKGFGIALIGIGFLLAILTTLFICGHEEQMLAPTYSYKMGILSGVAIGVSLTGGILRIYSASNS